MKREDKIEQFRYFFMLQNLAIVENKKGTSRPPGIILFYFFFLPAHNWSRKVLRSSMLYFAAISSSLIYMIKIG